MRIILSAVIVLFTHSLFSQVVGSRSNSDLTPTNISASKLSGGGIAGEVNVFNGSYSAGQNIGSVSTPGGLAFTLNLNYSPTYSTGQSPSVTSGIPYGEGWSLDVPMISVSNAAYFPFHETYVCSYRNNLTPYDSTFFLVNDTINGIINPSAEHQSDIFWFSPQVFVPGVGSGRAVFKYIDVDDGNCAVFVMNKFEKYIELRYRGTIWELIDDSGNKYFFNTTMVTYRSPNNERILNYDDNNINHNNQAANVIEENDYLGFKEEVLNVIEPKKTYTSWYCNLITNPNIPNQSINPIRI